MNTEHVDYVSNNSLSITRQVRADSPALLPMTVPVTVCERANIVWRPSRREERHLHGDLINNAKAMQVRVASTIGGVSSSGACDMS